MPDSHNEMRAPDFLVFARIYAAGFLLAGYGRAAWHVGKELAGVDCRFQGIGIVVCFVVLGIYLWMRNVKSNVMRLYYSYRVDLLIFAIIGVWSNFQTSAWLLKFDKFLRELPPTWISTPLLILFFMLFLPICRKFLRLKEPAKPQINFLSDDEIKTDGEDCLNNKQLAVDFADTVLASNSQAGLVFGIDGSWGTGKTSFINLAEQQWQKVAGNSVIIFRFEALRYAAEPDLSERFIRDLTATIQHQVYAPEFYPAATRYLQMVKDISLSGFKLSMEPLSKTIDELLEDIDIVLKNINRRVIVIIDDLDRLEAKAVNNILFSIRRTFKLSQATYILCYDTENLVKNGRDDGKDAREFLEKFNDKTESIR